MHYVNCVVVSVYLSLFYYSCGTLHGVFQFTHLNTELSHKSVMNLIIYIFIKKT